MYIEVCGDLSLPLVLNTSLVVMRGDVVISPSLSSDSGVVQAGLDRGGS